MYQKYDRCGNDKADRINNVYYTGKMFCQDPWTGSKYMADNTIATDAETIAAALH